MRTAPGRADAVIGHVVARHAEQRPDIICTTFADGSAWTWAQARAQLWHAAGVLADHGVRPGDHVLILLPNGAPYLRAWWAVTALGAVMVPVHTAYRGEMLRHICRDSGAKLVIADPELTARLDEIDTALERVDPAVLAGESDTPPAGPPVEPWDIATVNYTSGTTGPAKGVVTPHLQTYYGGRDVFGARAGLRPDDRWLVDLPLFHVAAQQITLAALSVGASIAVRPLFDGRDYWGCIRSARATFSLLAGTMGGFLLARPEQPSDRGHGLRTIVAAPIVADHRGFLERFGIAEMVTAFGSTETGAPTIGYSRDGLPEGTCGRPRDGITLRLVDAHDHEVPVGDVGEMIMRTERPWELNQGYHGRPEATVAAWRNGWFHTGDSFRRDAEDNYFFVDRLRDSLRRRGENISSFQVEHAVAAHRSVAEAACVAYPGSYGEDDVKVFVVPTEGAEVDFAALLEFLADRLAHYAVPRYFELIDALPMTTTKRVRKGELRDLGNSARTWDRERHGFTVGRAGLVRTSVKEQS